MFSSLNEANAGNNSLRDLLNIFQRFSSFSDGNWFLTEYF